MSIFWFSIFVILLVIELSTANLITIWFAIGAAISMISSAFVDGFLIQLAIFVASSFVMLCATRPLVKKFKINEVQPTNSERVIGKKAEVTKKISPNNYGEVKIYGNYWTAVSEDNTFDVGTKVIVREIDGVKLIVDKEEEK